MFRPISQQDRSRRSNMFPFKNRTLSKSLDPNAPTFARVYTGPDSLLGGHACVCSPPHLRRAAARPGLPAGIYWLAHSPTAGRLVRSVLTTSAPQRHLWTINSDTKAVWTTAEPTHAASWRFSMPPSRRKLLKSCWQQGFGGPVPFSDGVICRALVYSRVKVRMRTSKDNPTVTGRLISRGERGINANVTIMWAYFRNFRNKLIKTNLN